MSTQENKDVLTDVKTVSADSAITKSEVAQQMRKKELKVRNVNDYVKLKSDRAIAKASRVIEKERRAYVVRDVDDKHAEVLFTTFYDYTTDKKQLTRDIMRKLAQDFITAKARLATFTVKDVYTHFDITGSSRSDLPRAILFEVAKEFEKAQIEKNLDECLAKAAADKKQLIFYDIFAHETKRPVYNFVKV